MLIHRDWAPLLGVEFGEDRLADQHIRPVNEVLARVQELQNEPFAKTRDLPDRMVGVCRHYAVLYAALLRRHGTAARARAGSWRTGQDPDWEPTDDEVEMFDDLARVIVSYDFDEIRRRYESNPVKRQIISFVNGDVLPVDLGDLISET